jgi:hypothetical protein
MVTVFKREPHRGHHNNEELRLFLLFLYNFAVVLDFLILQDKYNIRTCTLSKKSNSFALAAKQERKYRQRLTAFLFVTNVHINYISNHKL